MVMVAALAMGAASAQAQAQAQDARPLCTDAGRACLLRTARAYFDAIMRADARVVPFAADVRVTEQGHVVATSRAAFLAEFRSTGATRALRNMRFIVDPASAQVAVLVVSDVKMPNVAPFAVRRIQRLRITRGLIRDVEIILYRDDTSAAALWPDREER